uniref:Uncharacterized protein n=1 Tax=viral metagenome TaxID=1070528 RepID=A0A6C0BMB5_9ZZZZ
MQTKKSISKKSNVDTDYNKQVKQFASEYRQLPLKRKKLKQIQRKYSSFSNKDPCVMDSDEFAAMHQLKTEINSLAQEITNLEQMNEMTDFYIKTGELMMDYYDTSPNKPSQSATASAILTTPMVASNIEKFLGNHSQPLLNLNSQVSPQRADLYEEFLIHTDPRHLPAPVYHAGDDFCPRCQIQRELIPNEATMICPKCGEEVQTIMESDKPSYHDPPHDNMYFAYKRINHFKEQLAHFQAKETTKIPQEVYDAVLVEFKKERRIDLSTLDKPRVKKYLQKYAHMGYNKYYENINQIIYHLNGIQPVSFTPETEDQLCNMFLKIQEPFERHCPPGRTNFLSYAYVIYKFCQLLGYTEFLPQFNLLKSKDKLCQQDKIWKKICVDLNWAFQPSTN